MTQDRKLQDLRRPIAVEALPRKGWTTFSSLAYRDYRFLWISILFTSAGMWMEQVTLSWLVYDITESGVMLGTINAVRAIPFLIFGPLGGVAADRMDRKMLMMSTQATLLVSNLVIGIIIVGDNRELWSLEVWHLFVFAFVNGIAWSFNQPARQSVLPNIVPGEALLNATALTSAGFNVTRVVGPAVAGLLLYNLGPSGNFFIQAVAYVGVVAMIYLMKVPENPSRARDVSVVRNLTDGMRYVASEKLILTLLLMALIPMILAMPYATLMPVFSKKVFAMGPDGLGWLMSAPGVGALAATLTLASLADFRRKGALLCGAAVGLGACLVLFGASTWLPLSLLFLVGVGGTMMAYMTTTNTLLQLLVPNEFRGRVMSIYMLDHGLTPLGSFAAGAAVDIVGAPITMQAMGIAVMLVGLAAIARLPYIRRLQ